MIKIDKIIKTMRYLNPYPSDVFKEPTKKEFDLMNEALRNYGLTPDRFFGSWGRTVWNNCIDYLKDILEDYNEMAKTT